MNTHEIAEPYKLKGLSLLIPAYLIGILFDYFIGMHYIGISFPIMTIFIFNIFFIYAGIKNKLTLSYNWLFLVPVFLLSFSFAITDNFLLRAINMFLVPLLMFGTFILITSPPEVKWFKFGFLETFGHKLNHMFENIPTPYQDAIKNPNLKQPNMILLKKIGIGVGIGLLLGGIITILLASADQLFDKFVGDFFHLIPDFINQDIITHLIKIVIVSSLFGGFFYAIFNKKTHINVSILKFDRIFDPLSVNIALSMIVAIYVFFGAIQFIYLFGGDTNIFEVGLTFSAYAVSGFWELVMVSFINLGIILVILALTKFKNISTKIILVLINALTFILIYSAHLRLTLYEITYGFSELRIYAHIVILFLFALFIYMGYKIVNSKSSFTKAAVIIWLTIYTILNFINVEGYIVSKNIDRYEETGKIDIPYIRRLSTDAIPEFLKLRTEDVPGTGKGYYTTVNKVLESKYIKLHEKIEKEPWHSFNLSRSRALDLLSPYYAEKN